MLPGKIEGDYIVFETEHFSDYVVTGSVAEIKIRSLPNKTNYYTGDLLDIEGLSLTLNGNAVNTGYICTPPVLIDEGEQIITVTYGKATTQFTVNVKKSFFDIHSSDYFYDAVLWAVENGITNGTSSTTFSPSDGCTRAQVVTFLWRAAGKPSISSSATFSDVPKNEYYTDAVAWAVNKGITNGVGNNRFDPNATCTRAQIVTFLWRYKGSPSASVNSGFSDVPSNEYYAAPVTWAVRNSITNGVGDNKFDPNATCTRGQVVTFLYRSKDVKASESQTVEPTPSDPPPVEPSPVDLNAVTNGVINDSWEAIIASTKDGTYKNKYHIGDTKALDLGLEGVIDMQIAAFDADELADGSGKAAITWISKECLKSSHRMNPAEKDERIDHRYIAEMGTGSIGGWEHSEMRAWLKSDILPLIPNAVRDSIKPVLKSSYSYDKYLSDGEYSSIDNIWIPSWREVFGEKNSEKWAESSGPVYNEYFTYCGRRESDSKRIKYKNNDTVPSYWCLRSAAGYGNFEVVDSEGKDGYRQSSTYEEGVLIGFCV